MNGIQKVAGSIPTTSKKFFYKEGSIETDKILLHEMVHVLQNKNNKRIASLDIQENYFINDYINMLSYLENTGKRLIDNEAALYGLSDTELAKLEQCLRGTAEFIGLDTGGLQSGSEYKAVEADFPMFFDAFSFPNPLEMLLFFIDPEAKHIRQQVNPKSQQLTQVEIFAQMTASEQMVYLRSRYEEGKAKGGRAKGGIAGFLRGLRSEMKLDGLFSLDHDFMNKTLREFLNINENGIDCYTFQGMVESSGWSEMHSFGARYHQSKAITTTVSIIIGYNKIDFDVESYTPIYESIYNRLNAKFTNIDGREAIFNYHKLYIDDGPDQGTYNYANVESRPLLHQKYDVAPFENNTPDEYDHDTLKLWNSSNTENSHYWRY